MRHLLLAAVMAVAVGVGSVQAAKVEMTGVHVCCPQCENIAKAVLAKVEGVSEGASDKAKKTVTFTAKDDKAATAGLKALADAGYYGKATIDGKEAKIPAGEAKAEKADAVTIKAVHVCCGACKTALTKLLGSDVKIEYGTAGEHKATEVKLSGKGIDKAEILKKLRDGGFNGTVE